MITIAVLVVTFAASTMAGAVVLRAGIAREQTSNSLLRQPPTRAAAATRWIVDFKTQVPQR